MSPAGTWQGKTCQGAWYKQDDGDAILTREGYEEMKTLLTKYVRPAVVLTVLLTVLTGMIYPGVVTALAQVIFPYQANGSLHSVDGKLVGSDLIGQEWTSTKYFHGRPSATANPSTGAPESYAADNSTASNLGPTSAKLINGNGTEVAIAQGTPVPAGATPVLGKPNTYYVPGTYLGVQNYTQQFRQENGLAPNVPVPVDMVTASGSGLDPDISIAGALLQVNRVAHVRNLSPDTVRQLVNTHVQGRFLGIFGEPYINVLDINLALDALKK
jgi:K+-transporting ATPase ATPase C chain